MAGAPSGAGDPPGRLHLSEAGAVGARPPETSSVLGEKTNFVFAGDAGGIRVPFVVRWPGVVPAGKVDRSSVLTAVDLIPTFLEAAYDRTQTRIVHKSVHWRNKSGSSALRRHLSRSDVVGYRM